MSDESLLYQPVWACGSARRHGDDEVALHAAGNSEIAALQCDFTANCLVSLIDSVDLVDTAVPLHRTYQRNSLGRNALARDPGGTSRVEHGERRRLRQIENDTVERFMLAADEPQRVRGGGAPGGRNGVCSEPVAGVLVGPIEVMDGQGDGRRSEYGRDRQ